MKRPYLWNFRTRQTLIIVACLAIILAVVIALAFLTRWFLEIMEISPLNTPSYDLAVFFLFWLVIALHFFDKWASELMDLLEDLLEVMLSPPKPSERPDGNQPVSPSAQSTVSRYINFKYRCTACGYITDKSGRCPQDHLELKEYDPVEDNSRLGAGQEEP